MSKVKLEKIEPKKQQTAETVNAEFVIKCLLEASVGGKTILTDRKKIKGVVDTTHHKKSQSKFETSEIEIRFHAATDSKALARASEYLSKINKNGSAIKFGKTPLAIEEAERIVAHVDGGVTYVPCRLHLILAHNQVAEADLATDLRSQLIQMVDLLRSKVVTNENFKKAS